MRSASRELRELRKYKEEAEATKKATMEKERQIEEKRLRDGSINHAGSSNLFLHLSLSRSFHSLYPFLWVQTLMNSDFAGSTLILGVQISMFCATEAPFFLAPQEIRRLFPFEVDPLEDVPFLAVASASRSRGFQAIRGFQAFWLPQSYPRRCEIWFDSEK